MADKQATVYIVDLGKSMKEKNNGRSVTDLDYSLRYIWDRITTTISNGRKTDMVGVVGFRTDESKNDLAGTDEAYQNICVMHPISQCLMPDVRKLKDAFKPSETNDGDGISALVIGIQMITAHCKKLKYIKNIVLVTDGTGSFDPDGLSDIAAQLKTEKINLTILGIDFDDAEYGFNEEGKDQHKKENEEVLKNLCEECDGVFGTLEEAVSELGMPRLKSVRPVASYKGKLTLGDTKVDEVCFAIDVERYPRTMVAKPVSASRYVDVPGSAEDESSEQTVQLEDRGAKELQAVKMARAYKVDDEENPERKKEIERDELEKGYKYGRTVVPISATDELITILPTESSMQIVGFIPVEKYERYFHMSPTNIIVGQKGNDAAQMALSSLIHALYELDSYALFRFVKRNNDPPVMLIVAPSIEGDYECLIDVQVPFVEDVRHYTFPPLGVVKTVRGKTLDKHRNIPTDDMHKYMSDYVDSMDLDRLIINDENQPSEYAPVEDTFSPILHRINQVIRHRAIHPDQPIPEVPEVLVKYSRPPEDLADRSKQYLDKLIAACDVKKVDAKAKSRRGAREQPKPKSGLDIQALLGGKAKQQKTTISLENAVPEFKRKLKSVDDDSEFKDAAAQMLAHVKTLIKGSMGPANYGRACELLRVMREEFAEFDAGEVYNDVLQKLKDAIVAEELDGNRMDMWKQIKDHDLGLIVSRGDDGTGDVTEEDVREVSFHAVRFYDWANLMCSFGLFVKLQNALIVLRMLGYIFCFY
ncbi:putative Ku family DNA helicase [Geopyxis carbonaria]|nr:putative Ku family DNA helicase [Geopyxis carbonaria]